MPASADPGFTVLGIDHVVLRVTDLQRSIDFYAQTLGLSPERIVPGFLCQLRCGSNLLDIMQMPEGQELAAGESRGSDHVCLRVTGEMSDIIARLKDAGSEVVGPMELYGATGYGTSVYVFDPDGHRIELKTDRIEYPMTVTLEMARAMGSRPSA